MRISNNQAAANAAKTLANNTRGVTKASERLASGKKINSAGDDAAGLAISEKLRQNIQGLTVASRNTQDTVSLVQTAEAALGETHSVLQRMNELANQASNGIYGPEERAMLDREFQALKEEVDDIAGKTAFNGRKLLDGSFSAVMQSGANEGDVTPLELRGMGTVDLGLEDSGLASGEISRTALKVVESAVNTVSSMRAELGAVMNQMEYKLNSINTTIENQQAAESRIRDADYGREATDLAVKRILEKASLAMQAQANVAPRNALKLLNNE